MSSKVVSKYIDNDGNVNELVIHHGRNGSYMVSERYKQSKFNGRGLSDWISLFRSKVSEMFAPRVNWSEGHSFHFGEG